MRKQINLTLVIATIMFFSQASAQQTAKMTSSGVGYMEYLPQGYNSNTNKYPVVIALHGIKEKGNTLADVPRVANVGLPKLVKYGQQYPFILISPQLKTTMSMWSGDYVMQVVNYVKTKLRIDEKRIYLTGLSLGGYGVWKVAAAYPSVFAAMVPICSGGNSLSAACTIAKDNLATWAFHGTGDATVSYQVSLKMVNAMNDCSTKCNPLAKITLYDGLGHIIWDKVYKESGAVNWMLQFVNGSAPSGGTTPEENAVPVVSAGSNKSITLPTNDITIQGSASDPDGTISSYLWTKVSGGAASLSGTTSSKLVANNLAAGSYSFRLTVKDNDGASRSDDMVVTVNSTSNIAPVANAGADKTVTGTATKLYGTGTDADGTINGYKWYKISGPASDWYGVSKPTLELSNMHSGTHVFRLEVTDNKGMKDTDDIKVVVNGGLATIISTAVQPDEQTPPQAR